MAAYNGWMGAYNVPDVSPALSDLVEASDTVRTNMQNRAIGNAAATGKLSDAANVAFKQGNVKTGLAIKDLDDERRDKVGKIIGEAALNADTPEKWAQLQASVSKRFPGEELEPFEERDGVVSMYRDYYKDRDDARADRAEGRANRSLALQEENARRGDFDIERVKQADGSEALVRVNKRTGETSPLAGAGAPSEPANPYYSGKFTGEQGKVAGFADRIGEADDVLSDPAVTNAAMSRVDRAKSQVPVFGNELTSTEFQKYDQAQRNFINAVLRRESGAVISQEEFENAALQYFPQPGDAPEKLAQKAQNRKTVYENLAREAGPNYRPKKPKTADDSKADGWKDLGNGVRIREKK